jgi:hypothetical protein
LSEANSTGREGCSEDVPSAEDEEPEASGLLLLFSHALFQLDISGQDSADDVGHVGH